MSKKNAGRRVNRRATWSRIGTALAVLATTTAFLFSVVGAVAVPSNHRSGTEPTLPSGASEPTASAKAKLETQVDHLMGLGDQGAPSSNPLGYGSAVKRTSIAWAGYADVPPSAGEIQEVTAEWTVPVVTCSPSFNTGQVSWVGIDGWGNGNVEQAGTASDCFSGTPTYFSWWEFFPYNGITLQASVNGGDLVAANVLYNPSICYGSACGVYTLVFQDFANGVSWVITGNPSVCDSSGCENGPDATVECISEAPQVSSTAPTQVPLSKYGTTGFSACAAEINGHFRGIGSFGTLATLYKIREKGDVTGNTIQAVSLLTSYYYGKSSFTLTWKGYD
jgi:hypothetical protein